MNSKAKKGTQMTSKKEVVNQRVIDRFDFKSFQRFNQLGLATRIGLLKKIGEAVAKSPVASVNVTKPIQGDNRWFGHWVLVKIGNHYIFVWVPSNSPIIPYIEPDGRLNVNKFVSNIKEIEKTNIDDSHVFIKLTDKKGNKMEMQICKS